MAAIHDLLEQVQDEELRNRLKKEIDKLSKTKKFGLVFEDHIPECTPLYDVPVKVGKRVAKHDGKFNDIYCVVKIDSKIATCVNENSKQSEEINVENLVCVAEFGEPIYPYLQPIDSICNAPDSDLWHTLIEADNYHALQLLEYLYAGKVDCIYIDPPYNTGARDWKYNNDYVDGNDAYMHSKWLSMMKKRLLIAKKLLNPEDSVLVVTIDEKEYLHLGCLLEEIFSNANMQMISSIIKSGTSMRQYEFSRCNEYIFYLRFGAAVIEKEIPNNASNKIPWRPLMRGGTGSNNFREKRPNSFYPIFVNSVTGKFDHVGEPLLPYTESIPVNDGNSELIPIWPIDKEGRQRVWGASSDTLRDYISRGYARIIKSKSSYNVQYITTGVIKDIANGKLIVTGQDDNGGIKGTYVSGKAQMPQNQWNIKSHNATTYGTNLLKDFIGNRFTFPKSLYAVKDTIQHVVRNKKDALVLDFFSGSGTTMHAVNLLNAEDGGNRRCIMVTNNEVSDAEAKQMAKKGLKPGDTEWEKLGIARYVTWPRTTCSIKGEDINGNPLKGNYIGCDKPMSDGFKANASFFKLGFLDKNSVQLGRQFKELLPVIWMKAGAKGLCPTVEESIQDYYIFKQNKFAILCNETFYSEFVTKLKDIDDIKAIFIVTDSQRAFKDMIADFQECDTYQLYRDYLDNFRINTGRG